MVIRRARPEDKDAVLRFATHTWHGWDYIPRVWDDWLVAPDSVLLVVTPGIKASAADAVDADGAALWPDVPIAMTRVVMVTKEEAWLEGVRVDPRVRGMGVATDLQVAELGWAAAQGARVVRYVTGEDNEGSHRLGAKHGFRVVTAFRWYGWDEDAEGATPPEAASVLPVPPELLVLPRGAAVGEWWARTQSDETFRAAQGLFEIRSWAFAALTRERFVEQVARGLIAVWPPPSDDSLSPESPWALAVLRGEPEGEDDPDYPVPPALLIGDPAAALDLATALGGGRAGLPRIRLPDPDPPLLSSGVADAWADAGWPASARATHLLERHVDEEHPVPEPDDPSLSRFDDDQVGDGKR